MIVDYDDQKRLQQWYVVRNYLEIEYGMSKYMEGTKKEKGNSKGGNDKKSQVPATQGLHSGIDCASQDQGNMEEECYRELECQVQEVGFCSAV